MYKEVDATLLIKKRDYMLFGINESNRIVKVYGNKYKNYLVEDEQLYEKMERRFKIIAGKVSEVH